MTIKGTGRLDFTGTPGGITASANTTIAQTLASLTFDNTGGQAPTVQIGNGDLTINGNITAGGTNVGRDAIANISRSGTGVINFGGATRSINVSPVTVDGVAVEELLPALNINAPIANASAINKTGNGLLRLTAQSTFSGDFNLQAGGIDLNASSSPSTFPNKATTGPVGGGNLNVSSGTFIMGNTAASLANDVNVLGTDLNFKGINNISLNANTSFSNVASTVSVAEAGMVATLGGVVSGPTGLALPRPEMERSLSITTTASLEASRSMAVSCKAWPPIQVLAIPSELAELP